MSEEENVEYVDDVTDNPETDDYLNEMLTESQTDNPMPQKSNDDDETDEDEVETDEEEQDEDPDKARREENKRNAERRIREKQEKLKRQQEQEGKNEEEDEEDEIKSPDEIELDYLRERSSFLEKEYQAAQPVLQFIMDNDLTPDKLQLGADFVRHWTTDRIGCVKMLLTSLEQSGINVGQILDHDERNLQVMQEVDRRMAPVMQQRNVMQQEARTRQEADKFISQYPDAIPHMGEIVDVMKRSGTSDPLNAYLALRRVYEKNGRPWVDRGVDDYDYDEEVEEAYTVQPSMTSHNVAPAYEQQTPMTTRDIIREETMKYFGRR